MPLHLKQSAGKCSEFCVSRVAWIQIVACGQRRCRRKLWRVSQGMKISGGGCTPIPTGPLVAPYPTTAGEKNLCQKVCFVTEPHLHIWIIHSAYKHIKWNVATRHLKAEIRPSQLIIKMSNVSGWTHALGSPPLVWWLYAQTIDKVSSYRLLRCWGLKRGFPSPLLLCRICQGRKTRPRTLNGFSNSYYTQPYSRTYFETKINSKAQLMLTC